MYGPGDEDSPLSIDHNGLLIVGHSTLGHLTAHENGHAEEDEQLGNRVGFHLSLSLSLPPPPYLSVQHTMYNWISRKKEAIYPSTPAEQKEKHFMTRKLH